MLSLPALRKQRQAWNREIKASPDDKSILERPQLHSERSFPKKKKKKSTQNGLKILLENLYLLQENTMKQLFKPNFNTEASPEKTVVNT